MYITHQTVARALWTSRTGFMRGSRIFCQAGGGGGGEVEARRPENSLDNVFLVINLFYSLQSGSNGFITEGRRGSNFFQGVGVSKETHIICDFPERRGGGGGPDPLIPLWIRTWGRLTPLFAYRIMVYQNLNKTEKYHPTTIKREKKLSPAGRDSKCGSRAGSGGPDPPGKLQVIWVSIEYKQLDPLEKVGPPLENVGPPLEPWKMIVFFFEINHLTAHGKQCVHGIAWCSNSSAKTSMCIQPCYWL